MNSVHEPGSRTMSKNLTQEKYRVEPGQKQAECTECTAQSQPARPGRAPRTCSPHALRPARLLPAARCPRALRATAARQRPAHVRAVPASPSACCALVATPSLAPHSRPAPSPPSTRLLLARPARAPPAPAARPMHPNAQPLVTIQFCNSIQTSSATSPSYVTIHLFHCNTTAFISAIQTTVLQHKNPYTSLLKPLSCNTIWPYFLQYNFFSCNTNGQ